MRSMTLHAWVLALAGAAAPAFAGPGYYLVTVYDDPGRTTVEAGTWTVHVPGEELSTSRFVGIGRNVTGRWYTELYAATLDYEGTGGAGVNDVTWQNDVLLTHGQYPFDLAMHTSLRHFRDRDSGDAFEWGPVLQTEFGRTQVNVNLFFERSYRAQAGGPMQFKYQWQVKHRFAPAFELGLQGFGEPGPWNDWDSRHDQSHRAGPVVSGAVPLAGGQALRYEAAWFTGKVLGEHAKAWVLRLKYQF